MRIITVLEISNGVIEISDRGIFQITLISIFASFSFISNLFTFSNSRICLPVGRIQTSSFFCAKQVTNKIDWENFRFADNNMIRLLTNLPGLLSL